MKLEEFNKLCDDFLKEYYIGIPLEETDVTSKYTIMVLYDLVLAIKEFSNSGKGIADIGKIHKVRFHLHLEDIFQMLVSLIQQTYRNDIQNVILSGIINLMHCVIYIVILI